METLTVEHFNLVEVCIFIYTFTGVGRVIACLVEGIRQNGNEVNSAISVSVGDNPLPSWL